MSRLKILPDAYYDLTLAETLALLDGETERETTLLRMGRKIATLIRNAHYKHPVDEMKYMPLPGDEELHFVDTELSAKDFIKAFGAAFRGASN